MLTMKLIKRKITCKSNKGLMHQPGSTLILVLSIFYFLRRRTIDYILGDWELTILSLFLHGLLKINVIEICSRNN